MRLIHRCVSIALVLIVILSVCISIVVFLPDFIKAEQDGDHSYTVSDGHATITGYTGDAGAITIPSTLGGYPVVAIGSNAFDHKSALISVTIPESVTSIDEEAFSYCTALNALTFMGNAPTVSILWSYQSNNIVVYYHDGATGFTTPTWMGRPCYPAVAPTASFSTDVISGSAPLSVMFTYTGVGANVLAWDFNNDGTVDDFFQNPGYTYNTAGTYSVKLTVSGPYGPNAEVTKVDYITVTEGPFADFTYSSNETSVTIDSYVGPGGNVVIPSEINGLPVTTIGMSAFQSGYSLTSITIPDSVTSIEMYAFDGCTSLTSVTIPGSVTYIGMGAFMGCTSLTSVTLSHGVKSISTEMFHNCQALNSVTIPSTVDGIEEYAFLGCKSLKALTIPEGVTGFGPFAFQGSGLTSLTIPGTVESVGWFEFVGCSELTSVTFSEGVKSIGIGQPFSACYSLTTVNIPSSLTSISVYGFQGCSLTSINVDEDNPVYTSIDGVLYDKAVTELILCPWDMKSATIPASVTIIGEYAFGECMALTSITFLGLVAPTNVGPDWIYSTPAEIRGHAYAASNFPPPGDVWNNLMMGDYISEKSGAPTGLVVDPGNNQVHLSWTAPNDDGGSPITGYNLSWALTAAGPYTSIVVDGTSYLHENLDNGRTYYYKVAAINAIGESNMTEVVSATPLVTIQLPSAPLNVVSTVINGNVSLTWTAPADGGQILSYKIYRGTSTATIGLLTSISGTSFLDVNVSSNQTYYYQVSAVSSSGEGERSADVSVTVQSSSDNGQDYSRPFLDTLEGQVAMVGLIAVAGVGAVTYAVWRRRRP